MATPSSCHDAARDSTMRAMTQLAMRVDLGGLSQIPAALKTAVYVRLHGAVDHVGQMTAAQWKEAVSKARLWAGERQAYADSITWTMIGDLKGEVEAAYGKSREIEFGRPARDLKKMLDTSSKVRVNKQGKRYLIIPFRHNTSGHTAHANDMPDHVYAAAKKLPFSRVSSMGTRVSGTGAFDMATKQPMRVPQVKYVWGGRLPAGSMGPNPKHRVDRFAGMVRMADTSGKSPKSIFMTFRVMMEGSPGWIVAPQPGQNIAAQVLQQMKPIAQQEFAGAVKGVVL